MTTRQILRAIDNWLTNLFIVAMLTGGCGMIGYVIAGRMGAIGATGVALVLCAFCTRHKEEFTDPDMTAEQLLDFWKRKQNDDAGS